MATKWGIVSAGKICHDFVANLLSLPKDEHEVIAIAARDVKSAAAFAAENDIPKSYGSYVELANDKEVEVVYIGTINSYHFDIGKLMLESGKHVLMEKPLTLNVKQTKQLIEIAKKNKCFLMEAIWSRFLPSYIRLMEMIKAGEIGEVVHVNVNFGIPLLHKERIMKKTSGGGTILDLGIYCINAVTMIFNGDRPKQIETVGHLSEEGVDIAVQSSLLYENNRSASITTSALAQFPCDMVITGTKGLIKVPRNMWCPTEFIVKDKKFEFPLPETVKPCHFVNSSGLQYEAKAVRNCLKQGLLENSLMPLKDSMIIAEIMDKMRHQIGVVFAED